MSRKILSVYEGRTFMNVRDAYNLTAKYYDSWKWQNFWRRNEKPIIIEAIRNHGTVDFALDIGTGTGLYLKEMPNYSKNSIGIDISEEMLKIASKEIKDSCALVQADARNLPFRDSFFDLIVLARMLSHVQKIDKVFENIARVSRKDALVVISDVHHKHNYEKTNIPYGAMRIFTETRKHNLYDVFKCAEKYGFSVADTHIIKVNNMNWKPERNEFTSIDIDGDSPVGYIMCLRR